MYIYIYNTYIYIIHICICIYIYVRINIMIIIQPGEKTSAGDPWELQRRPGPTAADCHPPSHRALGCGGHAAQGGQGAPRLGEGLENSEISWGKWGETMLNQVKPGETSEFRDFKGLDSERIWDSVGWCWTIQCLKTLQRGDVGAEDPNPLL